MKREWQCERWEENRIIQKYQYQYQSYIYITEYASNGTQDCTYTPKYHSPSRATISWSLKPMRPKMSLTCELVAPGQPRFAPGRRPSGTLHGRREKMNQYKRRKMKRKKEGNLLCADILLGVSAASAPHNDRASHVLHSHG